MGLGADVTATENVIVCSHERVDDLQRGGLKIIQDPGRFCFGTDAVLLSGFARVKRGERVLDLGTGTGIVPLLLAAKTKAAHITGLEIQPESVEMARRSVALNGLEERVSIHQGDLRRAAQLYKPSAFQVITVNPPYMKEDGGPAGAADPKTISRREILCTLEDVAVAAAALLSAGGRLYMVHRPDRLTDVLCALRGHGLEPKRLRFAHPRQGAAPELMLLEAMRFGKPAIKVLPPLVIYGEDGGYTAEVYDIYYN